MTAALARLAERFWRQVDRSDDCWMWTGPTNSQGYGRLEVWTEGRRTRFLAHRLALVLSGVELAPGCVVRHSCDTPRCVNPSHLTPGTQTENMRDAVARGRMDVSGLKRGRAQVYPPRPCRDCGVTVTEGRRRTCSACKEKATRASRARYVMRMRGAA